MSGPSAMQQQRHMRCDYKRRHYAEIELVFKHSFYKTLYIRVCRKCFEIVTEEMGYKLDAIYEIDNDRKIGCCVWLKGREPEGMVKDLYL